MDVFYDELPRSTVQDEEPMVSYAKYADDGTIPKELEEFFVEPAFKRRIVTDGDNRYLISLKEYFGPGALVSYAQIMDWEVMKGSKKSSRGTMAWITQRLNRLFKSGKIRKFYVASKYQMGIEERIRAKINYGVTYKLSDAETGFDT